MSALMKAVKVVDAVTMTADIFSRVTSLRASVNWAYQMIWTGTPVGTWDLQVSNDYVEAKDLTNHNGTGSGCGTWTSYTLTTSPTAPAGTASNTGLDLSFIGFAWMRLKYVFTSGTGSLTTWVAGKGA